MPYASDSIPDTIQQGPAVPSEKVAFERLEDQIAWYSARSHVNQKRFKLLKAVTVIAAAVIPVFTTSGVMEGSQIAAALGVLIVIVEGLQQMNQYQPNWTSYRLTGEALKHEKYLYLAKAGPYSGAANPASVLAERVESLISQEESKWIVARTPRAKP